MKKLLFFTFISLFTLANADKLVEYTTWECNPVKSAGVGLNYKTDKFEYIQVEQKLFTLIEEKTKFDEKISDNWHYLKIRNEAGGSLFLHVFQENNCKELADKIYCNRYNQTFTLDKKTGMAFASNLQNPLMLYNDDIYVEVFACKRTN